MAEPSHLFFDVNETLIDIGLLRAAVADRLGGAAGQADRWFNALIEYALAESLCGQPAEFTDIAAAVLAMLVAEEGGSMTTDDARELVQNGLDRSHAFADVAPGLARLKQAGFTLVALSNSGAGGLQQRLAKVGLAPYFDQELSVQPAGAYKPDQRTYGYALAQAGVAASDAMMVACHPWDLMGAQAKGMQTGFIERPGAAWYPLARAPDYRVATVDALADVLIAANKDSR